MDSAFDRMRRESMAHYGFGPEAMKNTKVCLRCGASAPASARLCGECGARLPRETLFDLYKEAHPYCGKCNTVVSDSAQFCPRCGEKISTDPV